MATTSRMGICVSDKSETRLKRVQRERETARHVGVLRLAAAILAHRDARPALGIRVTHAMPSTSPHPAHGKHSRDTLCLSVRPRTHRRPVSRCLPQATLTTTTSTPAPALTARLYIEHGCTETPAGDRQMLQEGRRRRRDFREHI